jgi:hypothetical protein
VDPILRDTMFAGLSDREIAEAVVCEMRRRKLYGCLYAFHSTEGTAIFASSSPEGSMRDFNASQQLAIFSQVANTAIVERNREILLDDGDEKGYVN